MRELGFSGAGEGEERHGHRSSPVSREVDERRNRAIHNGSEASGAEVDSGPFRAKRNVLVDEMYITEHALRAQAKANKRSLRSSLRGRICLQVGADTLLQVPPESTALGDEGA
mmetsp:Transcript_4893/g.14822  ORF Transcript_4893/g.14822 Transcript_4893/m.14822 type:complete len:113 (-) Transcript_4893:1539-1877(-)